MEVIILDAAEFEQMLQKLETFAAEVKALLDEHIDRGTKKWLSSQEACRLLGVSLRTLQTYRDNGTLPYAQIGHKVFLRPQDIEKVINQSNYTYGKE
jgi:excisionase family DNA binding protein